MPGILSKLLGGNILKGVGGIIDKFKLSPEDKKQFELDYETLLQKQESEIEETYRAEVNAKMQIITAELNQGDTFTKRARPMIVYSGLLFIFIVHVAFPIITYWTGNPMPELALPEAFWWSYSGVTGAYAIGRSMEKRGVRSKVTSLMSGSMI